MREPVSAGSGLAVLVTGATFNSGLAIVRELGRDGFRVIGADSRRLPFGLHSRYAAPYRRSPRSDDPECVERLLDLIRETRPDVFLPSGTPIVGAVVRERERFERLTAVNVPDPDAFLAAADNLRTTEECLRLGIPCPAVLAQEEAERALSGPHENDGCRVVVKPRLDHGGARGVGFCRDVETLQRRLDECRSRWGEPFLQEYIPGGATAMRTVLLLFDRRSRLLAHFTTRKIRQWPPSGGTTALSVSTDERCLVDLCLPFFEACKWRGPAEVELKLDSRDGSAKVIEINPRFPSYVGFPCRCGLPFPRLAALAAIGRIDGYAPIPYATGLHYMNPMAYLKSVTAELLRGRRKPALLRQVLSEIRSRHVGGSFDPSDPWPRIGKILDEIRHVVPTLRRWRGEATRNPPGEG